MHMFKYVCIVYTFSKYKYIYKHLYICTCIYRYIDVSSSLGVNSIRHKVKDSQELKCFDKSDPQPDPEDENIWARII